MLGNALLGHCQLEPQSGPLSIGAEGALTMYRGRISGALFNVPWGRHVQHVVAITGGDEPHIVLLETAQAQCTPILNTAGEPRDTLQFDNAHVVVSAPLPADVPADVLHTGGAMLRSAQIAGALQGVLAQTIQYASERVQFGKAIGSFQALQHHMAVLAEHTGCVAVASECAFARALDGAAGLDALGVAAAKICSAEAAVLPPRWRIPCMERSASRTNTHCISQRAAFGLGAANSATQLTGRNALGVPYASRVRTHSGQPLPAASWP
jgi:acyl-CoA dehydrogenase